MTAPHTYITTTIPYVNARPHIGFALEVVQADVLARFRRQQGDRVRFQAGTDDNSKSFSSDSKYCSPRRQSSPRSFVRKLATTIRKRLCIYPD